MKYASGAYTAVGAVEVCGNRVCGSNKERRGGRRFRSLLGFGLALAMVWSFAGCHKTTAQNTSANAMDPGDPANGNLAPVKGDYAPAQPAQVMGQSVQYQGQQQGEDYGAQPQGAPIERRPAYSGNPNYNDQAAENQQAVDLYASDVVEAEADQPPPPLPYYDQPPAPDPDYLWTPGYWAWGPGGYYWVPGCWVAAPYTGALWTPGYWGYYGGRYRFHHGFWGLHIGFYGGIDYGFGYTGYGYYGGYWDHDHFRYNTAVNRVNVNVIRNVYVHNVVINNRNYSGGSVNRVSYNGGRGGVTVQPRPAEVAVLHEQRHAPMAAQIQVQHEAAQNRDQFYNQNRGRPAVAVNARPVVADRTPPAALPRIAGPVAQPGGRNDMRPGQMQQVQPQSQRQGQPQQQQQRQAGQLQPRPGQTQQAEPQQQQRQGQPQSQLRQATPQQQQQQQRQEQVQPQQRQGQPQSQLYQATPQQQQQQQRQEQPQQQQQQRQAQPQLQQRQAQPQPQPQRQEQPQPPSQQQQRQAPPQPQQHQAPPQPQPQARPGPAPASHPQPQGQQHGEDKPHH